MHARCLIFLIVLCCNFGYSQEFSFINIETQSDIHKGLSLLEASVEETRLEYFSTNLASFEIAIKHLKTPYINAYVNKLKASFYYALYDYINFIKYYDKAYSYYSKHPDSKSLVYLYNLMAIYKFNIMLDKNEGEQYLKMAILESEKSTDETVRKYAVDAYFNLIDLYVRTSNWEACLKTVDRSIYLAEKYNLEKRLTRLYYSKAISLLNLNKIDAAKQNLKKSEKILLNLESQGVNFYSYRYAICFYGYYQLYKSQNDYKKASAYLDEYLLRMSSKHDEHIASLNTTMKNMFNLKMKAEELKILKAENELKKAKSTINRVVLVLAILIIVGLLIIVKLQLRNQKNNKEKNEVLTLKNNQLKRSKQKLEEAIKVKMNFFNSITHELRTPLYAIIGVTQLLNQKKTNDLKPSKLDILTFSSDHLLRVIDNVIDTNINNETIHLKLEHVSFNLQKTIYNLKETLNLSSNGREKNNFFFHIDKQISDYLIGDKLKLVRVLFNLLDNADKYTANGTIYVKVKKLKTIGNFQSIEFSIRDTGCGISKNQLKEIYTAYKTNKPTIKRLGNTFSGLGMGLLMVYKILNLFNSKLSIESEENKGTTFRFTIDFKIDTFRTEQKKEELFSKKIDTNKKILVVDDNRINRFVTKQMLNAKGLECDMACNGREAVKMVTSLNKYHFILMDIMMPILNGYESTKIIKNKFPNQKIIALTAISIKQNANLFEKVKFDDVIKKPFDIDTFYKVIDNYMYA